MSPNTSCGSPRDYLAIHLKVSANEIAVRLTTNFGWRWSIPGPYLDFYDRTMAGLQCCLKIRNLTTAAIAALETIMNQDSATASARVAAAEALLNRAWGRPTQPVAGDCEDGPVEIVVTWGGAGL